MENKDIDQIKSAALNSIDTYEDELFLSLIFGSEREGYVFIDSLEKARIDLVSQFPVLLEIQNDIDSNFTPEDLKTRVTIFFDSFSTINKNRFRPIAKNSQQIVLRVQDPKKSAKKNG